MRRVVAPSNHHFSVFRSGVLIGLSIPAIVAGTYFGITTPVIYSESNRETELQTAAKPKNAQQTTAMLQVYATLGIPVTFALLVGINLVAWARARINYMFIFGLNLRTVMNYREYFEVNNSSLGQQYILRCSSFP